MKIVLLTNGLIENEFLRKVIGRKNEILNDDGRRRTVMFKNVINEYDFDVCFVSPLINCFETALILVGDRVEIIRDDRIIQREMGELDGRPIDEYNAFKFWDYKLNRNDYGVEPIQDLFKRCDDFLSFLKSNYSNKNILIVTHMEVYRALRHLLSNHELSGNMLDGRIENLSLEEFNA